ncbi:MAG: folylpolyglutamate synthase/dihydrofolate synthase family protein [bacterium]|nr:folylpolyglutamate synthase/dihydrofolate synthase family protein [bacterium]
MDKLKYKEARGYIASLTPRGIVPGLKTMETLCAALGNPQDKIRTIHIAGTNGKGSAGAFVSSILRAAGYTVGRYVSPAVTEYREIIRLNDEYISEEDYAVIVSAVKRAAESAEKQGIYPTSFEAETAAAFLYFSEKCCDFAIIECGMGGLLDATNIIKKPEAAVITSISMDHMKFLGDTIEEIAGNKAGIIKSGIKVFSARQNSVALRVIKEKCEKEGAFLTAAAKPIIRRAELAGICFDYRELHDLYIPFAGLYQPENAAAAIDLCKALDIDRDTIRKGLRDTKWPLRFEIDSSGWIFDGAHNEDAAKQLRDTIDILSAGKKLAYIVGVFSDKAYDKIMQLTAPAADTIYTVKPPGNRGLSSSVLAETAGKYCKKVIDAESTANAVRLCAGETYDNVIVFGSLSFLAQIKKEKESIYEQMSKDN